MAMASSDVDGVMLCERVRADSLIRSQVRTRPEHAGALFLDGNRG
jgi:hypothetical protein